MKFIQKEPNDSVNIPRHHPLSTFLRIMGGFLVLFILACTVLNGFVSLISPHISPALEIKLGTAFVSPFFRGSSSSFENIDLQPMLDDLLAYWKERLPFRYRLVVKASDEINAYALPGGTIVATSGLIKQCNSENELAMIVGHELGHFSERHHLKQFGRLLLIGPIISLVTQNSPEITGLVEKVLNLVLFKFSRDEENKADLFALDLLVRKYGHAAGATDFFETMTKDESVLATKMFQFYSTHPASKNRIERLREEIRKLNYPLGKKVPLHAQ